MWNEQDLFLLNTGKHTRLYEKLGAHVKGDKTTFRVIAPNATKVELLCEYNNYFPVLMTKIDTTIWEVVIDENLENMKYKYGVHRFDYYVEKNDPFSFKCERPPHNSSIVTTLIKTKKHKIKKAKSLNIFEVHLGGYNKSLTTYPEIAKDIASYAKEMHYNFVEIMPVMEHPVDQSWGYQITNYYAPSTRYGSPQEFQEMVNIINEANVGVILDWVPVHFANDLYALVNFDGTPTFEYFHSHDAINELWGTTNFDLSKGLAQSFLISNLFYYIDLYNVDGFRMDAVSNMIFWRGEHNGVENVEAIKFIKSMNALVKEFYPDVLLIAEDSTAYPGVTRELGFDYKWCLGWMHDSLEYFELDFESRKNKLNKLTFSFVYMHDEKYILPLSHDEVVHVKGSILNKMYGNHDQKMQQLKLYYTYMFMHPGEKLNFMGNDLATYEEFSEQKEIEWHLKGNDVHEYFKTLAKLFITYKDLQNIETYEFLQEHQEDGVLVFKRGKYLIILNTQNISYHNYEIHVGNNKTHHLITSSELKQFGGNQELVVLDIKPKDKKIYYSIEALSAVILKEGKCAHI